MIPSLWILAFIIAVSIPMGYSRSIEECNLDDFDNAVKTALIFGDRDAILPTNMEEMQERCRVDENINNIWRKNMRGCSEYPLTRQVLSIILQSVKRMVRKRCNDTNYQQEWFRSIKCVKPMISDIHTCMDNFIIDLQRASESDVDTQLPNACCRYNVIHNCAVIRTRAKCDEVDTNFVNELLEGYAGDTLGLMCSGYEPHSPACSELVLPPLKEGVDLPKSMIPFVIAILDTISQPTE